MAGVLIVDDSRTSRRLLKDIVESKGHTVLGEAVNGQEALELYESLSPDLVTMDITMPVMDGVTALEELLDRHPDAMVVVVSAVGQRGKIVECIKLGAVDYVTKPYDVLEVGDIITGAIEKKSRSGHSDRQ